MNTFEEAISQSCPEGIRCESLDTLQVNLGRLCNLTCAHCHLGCSPSREELMDWGTMQSVIALVREESFKKVDITGGAPELHPDFRPLVSTVAEEGVVIQVRTNLLTLVDPDAGDLLKFLCIRGAQLVASLPCYLEENVDAQRGEGVYRKSIQAITELNELGYGLEPDRTLRLVYNPGGPTLPGDKGELQEEYRERLQEEHDIVFTELLTITNSPVGRFRDELETHGHLDDYMTLLRENFNPATLPHLMCKSQICVDYDGSLYDCDFNLALGAKVNGGAPSHVSEFDAAALATRRIETGPHCLACTAGNGSSCNGSLA